MLTSSRAVLLLRRGLALAPSTVARKRFVPPWEKDGKSAEDFFEGVLTSKNPVQETRKDEQRQHAAEEAEIAEDPLTPEDYRRREERDGHNAAAEEAQRSFLPYGATPREYFEEGGMAAWGQYISRVEAMPLPAGAEHRKHNPCKGGGMVVDGGGGGYSEETRALLRNDLHDKIPYRYTQYVPVPSDGKPRWPLHGTAGLVLDIDGVMHRSHKLIPGADTAIETLKELKVPFVFMTNGGAKSETEKAEELSGLLGTFIDPSQVLVSHSPMRLLAPLYASRNVLIVGPPHCTEIARSYGFRKALSLLDFQASHPDFLPYKKWDREPTVKPCALATAERLPFPAIDAIFQFHDPEDPFNDIQSLLDVLTAHRGRVGEAVTAVQSIPYYASADDLLWATEAPLPRLGQGAFREMLASVYECVTGQGLQTVLYGKPRAIAYAYAAQRLRVVAASLGWQPSDLRALFMVGDNVETDILGANAAAGPWVSVHVLSGLGEAPAARRTLAVGDDEHEWLETCVSKTPHYVAPTLDHFVRELLAFPEQALVQSRRPYYGRQNPVDLKALYNFTK